jgi:predicted acylesterase/phospholipase RssA
MSDSLGSDIATKERIPMSTRALILAGGGLKVCYQAGVLQVWLDEAGLTFDHADGASGGCLNLAMYCQGMSGQKIADNWRNLDPFLPVDANLTGMWPFSASLFRYDNFRQRVLPFWGIDFNAIRASSRDATFNVFNFSKKELELVPPSQLTEDYLIAAVSLPMWFPPVRINNNTYFDAVYITDSNLEDAVARGADELWAIWTVSRKDEWRDGFVNQYFQIVETVADTNFFQFWKRLEKNNAEIAAGRRGEFGRPIALNLIEAEVPVHYLLNFSRDRMAEAVNKGVEDARAWCRARHIALTSGPAYPPPPAGSPSTLQFTEEMKGFVSTGGAPSSRAEYEQAAAAGKSGNGAFMFHLDVKAPDVDAFITSPQHKTNVEGYLDAPLYGGRRPVNGGAINLFVDAGDPSKKQMRYRLFFTGGDGRDYTLVGTKEISGHHITDVWPETTTLYTRILAGRVEDGGAEQVLASGVLVIRPEDFLFHQLFSFRIGGPTEKRASAMLRFGQMFFGKLWDVYGRQLGPL